MLTPTFRASFLPSLLLAAFSCCSLYGQIIVTTADDEDDGPTSLETLDDISLREAIAHSTGDTRILFAPQLSGGTLILTEGPLEITRIIDKNLDISTEGLADGFTIDANGEVTNHRILKIKSGVHVSFDGITFTGGAVGGIFIDAAGDGTTVQLKNCTISGNSSISDGGGILVDHTVGSLDLSLVNCTISDNHSGGYGGGISSRDYEGSLSLSLVNCTISGNSTERSGGGIYCQSVRGGASLFLNHCTLTDNNAEENGGGIDIRAFSASSPSLTLRSCTLTKNSAENSNGGIFGSASGSPSSCSINLDNSILANTGSDLRAISGGPNNMTTVTATGVNILSNTAGSGFSASSEGIMVIPDPMLAPLGDYGGPTQTMPPLPGSPAIDAASSSSATTDQRGLSRSVDGDNDSTAAPDIGAVELQTLVVTTLTDEENEDPGTGLSLREAIANANSSANYIIFDPSLSGQTITLGGSQLLIDKDLAIDASALAAGITIDANQQFRIMEIKPNSTVSLHSLTLTGGSSPANRGGAIYCDGTGVGNKTDLTLYDCTFTGNSAGRGGVVYCDGANNGLATLNFNNCILTDNSAGEGGCIYSGAGISGSTTTVLNDCTLSDNSAGSGGTIYNTSGSGTAGLHLENCTLTDNSASSSGGGVYSYNSASAKFIDCTFSGNSANNGGAIYNYAARANSDLYLRNCVLTSNSAASNGGGISNNGVQGFAILGLENCILSGNSASGSGAGIYNNGSDFGGGGGGGGKAILSLSACTLSGNAAQSNGGGIYNNGSYFGKAILSLSACTLSDNSADNGGGIYCDGSNNSERSSPIGIATLSLSACTLSGNSAQDQGGGIYGDASSGGHTILSLSSCTVSGNSAPLGGGGIFGYGFFIEGNESTLVFSLSLSNTILAKNIGRDLVETGLIVTATGNNLLSSSDGYTIETGADKITLVPDPLLAPLGDYGGPTQTMPPLPGSSAIDAAGNVDPEGTDQRGLPRFADGALDIGAVEYQGDGVELAHTFYLDSDSDGILNGVELAIGTDPDVADQENANNLQLSFNEMGQAQLSFGLDHALQSKITLSLMRSTDLKNFDVEVMSNVTTDFSDPGTENLLMLEDPNPPAEGKAFYHLKAQLR